MRVRLLEIAAAELSRGDVRGDTKHRNTRAVAIEQAVDKVQVARPAASGADRELTCQMRLGARRECGNLLVPDVNPLDFSVTADGVGQAVKAVADNAKNPLNARSAEGFDELVSDCLRQGGLLSRLKENFFSTEADYIQVLTRPIVFRHLSGT